MHEPAFEVREDEYIQWDYGKGYIDALADTGLEPDNRVELTRCPWCETPVEDHFQYCPRCGRSLGAVRIYRELIGPRHRRARGPRDARPRRLRTLLTGPPGASLAFRRAAATARGRSRMQSSGGLSSRMPLNEGARIFFVLFVISRYSTSHTSTGSTNVAPFTFASSGSSIGGVVAHERLERAPSGARASGA